MARGRSARDAAPRIFRRRGWFAVDLRAWGQGRPTLRDPAAPGWPGGGERTDDAEVALRWALAYVDDLRGQRRRRHLGLGPEPRRLGAAVEEWLQYRTDVERRPYRTVVANRSALNHLRRHAAADRESGRQGDRMRTDTIGVEFLQRLFDALTKTGYAANTLATHRQSISTWLRWLGHGDRNAALQVVLPRHVHEEVAIWTDAEVQALRAAADRLDSNAVGMEFATHRVALELSLAAGARRNELFAIAWEAIDERTRTVSITHQISQSGRRGLAPLKGKLARRALLLPSWWEFHRPGETGLVLCGWNGEMVAPSTYTLLRNRLLAAAGLELPGVGWHRDRHTYARDFIVGVRGDFALLQKSLGHRSVATTERLYGHLHDDVAARLAAERIYPDGLLRAI